MNSLNLVTVSGYIQGEVKTFTNYMDEDGNPKLIGFDIAVPTSYKVDGEWKLKKEYFHCIAVGEKAKKLYKMQTAYLANKELDSETKGTGVLITGNLFTKQRKVVVLKQDEKNKFIPFEKATEKEKQEGVTTTFTNMTIWVSTITQLKRPNQNKKVLLTGEVKIPEEMQTYQKGDLFAVKLNLKIQHYNKTKKSWDTFYIPMIAFGEVAKSLKENAKNNTPLCINGVLTQRKNSKNGITYSNDGVIINDYSILANDSVA